MALDPRLALLGQPAVIQPFDLARPLVQASNLRSAGLNQQLAQTQLGEYQEELGRQNQLRGLFAQGLQTPTPGTSSGGLQAIAPLTEQTRDPTTGQWSAPQTVPPRVGEGGLQALATPTPQASGPTWQQIAALNPQLGLKYQAQQVEQQSAQLDTQLKRLTAVSNLARGILEADQPGGTGGQAAYDQARPLVRQLAPELEAQMPAVYNRVGVEQFVNATYGPLQRLQESQAALNQQKARFQTQQAPDWGYGQALNDQINAEFGDTLRRENRRPTPEEVRKAQDTITARERERQAAGVDLAKDKPLSGEDAARQGYPFGTTPRQIEEGTVPQGKPLAPLTGQAAKDFQLGNRMNLGHGTVSQFEERGQVGNALLNSLEASMSKLTGAIGTVLGSATAGGLGGSSAGGAAGYGVGNIAGDLLNKLRSPEERQYLQAQLAFIAGILRRESGAAITAEEYRQYGRIYFPQVGDDADTIAQKRQLRQEEITALQEQFPNRPFRTAPTLPRAKATTPQATPTPAPAPSVVPAPGQLGAGRNPYAPPVSAPPAPAQAGGQTAGGNAPPQPPAPRQIYPTREGATAPLETTPALPSVAPLTPQPATPAPRAPALAPTPAPAAPTLAPALQPIPVPEAPAPAQPQRQSGLRPADTRAIPPRGYTLSEADIQDAMRQTGRKRRDIIVAARRKGYDIDRTAFYA